MKKIVTLREATQDDWELMMSWRSHPAVFRGKYTQTKPLTWEEHYTFMSSRGPWWKNFIILVNDFVSSRKVGVVILAQLEDFNPQINSYIGETSLSDSSVEHEALLLAIDWLAARGYSKVHTVIKDNNEAWVGQVVSLGFDKVGPARQGETSWEKYISDESTSTDYNTGRRSL